MCIYIYVRVEVKVSAQLYVRYIILPLSAQAGTAATVPRAAQAGTAATVPRAINSAQDGHALARTRPSPGRRPQSKVFRSNFAPVRLSILRVRLPIPCLRLVRECTEHCNTERQVLFAFGA